MTATIMATPDHDPDEAPCVGAVCDYCQDAIVPFDSVAFSLAYLQDAIDSHDCGGRP